MQRMWSDWGTDWITDHITDYYSIGVTDQFHPDQVTV